MLVTNRLFDCGGAVTVSSKIFRVFVGLSRGLENGELEMGGGEVAVIWLNGLLDPVK